VYCGNNPVIFVDPFGQAYIPLRAMVESYGGSVSWDNGVATAKVNGCTRDFYVGDGYATYIDDSGTIQVFIKMEE
jgi:hypothetical protein